MNKHLISEGSAQIGALLISDYGGFECGPHENRIGYWAKLAGELTTDWNTMGHGLTYDIAIVSLFFLIKHNELPSSSDSFLMSKFYLEN